MNSKNYMAKSYKAKNYWNIYFSFLGESSFFIHACRSIFHLSVLMTGLVYTFTQQYFSNFEVWTFIYLISATALMIDAGVLIFYKQFKHWMALYLIDALFIGLILYKTGFVFFNFLYSIWLLGILMAGFQFRFVGAFTQALWVSSILTWLNFTSPHFEMSYTLYIVNNFALFLMASLGGLMGVRYQLFENVFKFIRHQVDLFVEEWKESCAYESDSEEGSANVIDSRFLNQFMQSKFENLIQRNTDIEFECLNINEILKEVINDLYAQTSLSQEIFKSSLKSSLKIFGQKENLKTAIFGVIRLFTSSNNFKKISLKTYDEKDWTVIHVKGHGMVVQNPLWLFNSFSSLFFIHKILNDHKGKILADRREFSVTIKLPSQKATDDSIQSA